MDITLMLATFLCFVCMACNQSFAEQFKLSSLPLLKKWEVPSMPQKYAMRVGRKFKNLDKIFATGRKRSSHWSIVPELNFRELDMEEDAEKIKLDQNYKAFLEDDDIPIGPGKEASVEAAVFKTEAGGAVEATGKRSDAAKNSLQFSNRRIPDKRYGITHLTNDANADQIKSQHLFGKSNMVSGDEGRRYKPAKQNMLKNDVHKGKQLKPFYGKGQMLDSSEGQGRNAFSTADIRSHVRRKNSKTIHLKGASNLIHSPGEITSSKESSDAQEMVAKRSIDGDVGSNLMSQRRNQIGIGNAVKRARIAISNLQNRKQGVNKPVARQNLMKLVSLKAGKAPRVDLVDATAHNKMQQKNLQESRSQALRLLKNSQLGGKGQVKNGVLGDQPSRDMSNKVKNNVQTRLSAPNINTNHLKSPVLNPVSKTHPSQPTKAVQISERTKIETPRAEIEKPKEKMKIVPANVARAVAMAMEQLKRDKMWGKVFVHVLPSGKLKVMVQETKKMPDE